MGYKKHSFAFVDGSYNSKTNTYGWGGFLIDKLGNKHILQGSGKEIELCKMRNVAGTMDYARLAKSAMKSGLKLYFKHVKAHSGVPFNEEADNLAKKSVGLG